MSDFFKNEVEVRQFFKNHILKFTFRSDGMIYFNTLNPIMLGGELYSFQISFYDNEKDFFCYSTLRGENGWLDKFQIAEVQSISESGNEHKKLYFKQFNTK